MGYFLARPVYGTMQCTAVCLKVQTVQDRITVNVQCWQ